MASGWRYRDECPPTWVDGQELEITGDYRKLNNQTPTVPHRSRNKVEVLDIGRVPGMTFGQANVTTAQLLLIARNDSRKAFIVRNIDGNDVWVAGASTLTAGITGNATPIRLDERYENDVYTGDVWLRTETGSARVAFEEYAEDS